MCVLVLFSFKLQSVPGLESLVCLVNLANCYCSFTPPLPSSPFCSLSYPLMPLFVNNPPNPALLEPVCGERAQCGLRAGLREGEGGRAGPAVGPPRSHPTTQPRWPVRPRGDLLRGRPSRLCKLLFRQTTETSRQHLKLTTPLASVQGFDSEA